MVEEIDIAIAIWNGFNKFVLAVIFLFMGFIIGKLVERFLYRFINDLNIHQAERKKRLSSHLGKTLSKTAAFAIYILTLIIALRMISLDKITIALFIAVILSALIISLIINIIYFVPNLIAGFKLHEKIKKNDKIKIGNILGRTSKVSSNIVIESEEGDVIYYPASIVFDMFRKNQNKTLKYAR